MPLSLCACLDDLDFAAAVASWVLLSGQDPAQRWVDLPFPQFPAILTIDNLPRLYQQLTPRVCPANLIAWK